MHGSGLELALVFLLAAVIAVPVFKRFGIALQRVPHTLPASL
ncbi:hypothetical protein LJR143_003465 [Pseudoxanthomonas sp. LjRoot143]